MREAAKSAKSEPSWGQRIASGWATLRSFALNAVGVMVFVGASWLLYDAVMKPTIAIAPISAPEELAKKGYTSEVMANKLRAALSKLAKQTKSRKGGADVAGQSDIPNIVVPRTGLSVETIAAQIRKISGLTNRWQVSGGVVAQGDLYEMNLKIANDVDSNLNNAPIAEKGIEQLIDASAGEILGVADPYLMALSYRRSAKLQESLVLAQKLVAQNPEGDAAFWAHNLIGLIYREDLHELDTAIKEFRLCINFQPADTFIHRAAVVLSRSLFGVALDKKYAVPHNGLGHALRNQGKLDEAIAEFKKAIELDPEDAFPHNNLGLVLRDQRKPDEAIAEYKKAIELDPKDARWYSNLGLVLHEQGKLDEAIAKYKKAIEFDPEDPRRYNNLGDVLRNQGKLDEAITEYQEAVKLAPDNAGFRADLERALEARKRGQGQSVESKPAEQKTTKK